jgi:hypothetical protein
MEKVTFKLLLCYVVTLALSISVYGQENKEVKVNEEQLISLSTKDKNKVKDKEGDSKVKRVFAKKRRGSFNATSDYIVLVDGKPFVNKNGTFLPVKSERVVGSMKVNASGKVVNKDGAEILLNEGEAVNMKGETAKANEAVILKKRVRLMDENLQTLEKTSFETYDNFRMLNYKVKWMNTKMDLANQKTLLMLEYISKPKMNHKEIEEYRDNLEKIDEAMEFAEYKIKDVEKLMCGESGCN